MNWPQEECECEEKENDESAYIMMYVLTSMLWLAYSALGNTPEPLSFVI